jgi:hypothetical protein
MVVQEGEEAGEVLVPRTVTALAARCVSEATMSARREGTPIARVAAIEKAEVVRHPIAERPRTHLSAFVSVERQWSATKDMARLLRVTRHAAMPPTPAASQTAWTPLAGGIAAHHLDRGGTTKTGMVQRGKVDLPRLCDAMMMTLRAGKGCAACHRHHFSEMKRPHATTTTTKSTATSVVDLIDDGAALRLSLMIFLWFCVAFRGHEVTTMTTLTTTTTTTTMTTTQDDRCQRGRDYHQIPQCRRTTVVLRRCEQNLRIVPMWIRRLHHHRRPTTHTTACLEARLTTRHETRVELNRRLMPIVAMLKAVSTASCARAARRKSRLHR